MIPNILIIEDDANLVAMLRVHLEGAGYKVTSVDCGIRGLAEASTRLFKVVLLDLGLPDSDGFEICRRIRGEDGQVPIIILTGRDSEIDRVLGLELGADDYITKPFSSRELLARIKVLLRRGAYFDSQRKSQGEDVLQVATLTIDLGKRSVKVAQRRVDLTQKEFDLLACLAKKPGKVFSRGDLLKQVWGYRAGCYEHTVNSHINRLRSKLEEDPAHPAYVQTVWGIGYKFRDPDDDIDPQKRAKD